MIGNHCENDLKWFSPCKSFNLKRTKFWVFVQLESKFMLSHVSGRLEMTMLLKTITVHDNSDIGNSDARTSF